ncbi:MAG: TraR/DksA family transcriptional regulator [Sulfuriferula sp.]|nr:TraR/DksA family transcriptional regulator [Sulfuriferula sp.]
MNGLSQTQQLWLEQLLNQRYWTLLEEVRDALEQSGQQQYAEIIGNAAADPGDAAIADALADLHVAMIDRQIHELRDIEAARQRMLDHIYGVCLDCGNRIAFDRLVAYPAAVRCISCQQLYEKTHAGENTPSL